jgi:hypothetical protein
LNGSKIYNGQKNKLGANIIKGATRGVDNTQNHDLKLLKKLERSKVILIVKEK